MEAHGRLGALDEVRAMAVSFPGDTSVQSRALEWSIALEDFHGAISDFHSCLKAGLKPDTAMYNTLIRGYASAGLLRDGMTALRLLPQHSTVTPSTETFRPIIHAAAEAGEEDLAMEALELMLANPGSLLEAKDRRHLIYLSVEFRMKRLKQMLFVRKVCEARGGAFPDSAIVLPRGAPASAIIVCNDTENNSQSLAEESLSYANMQGLSALDLACYNPGKMQGWQSVPMSFLADKQP